MRGPATPVNEVPSTILCAAKDASTLDSAARRPRAAGLGRTSGQIDWH